MALVMMRLSLIALTSSPCTSGLTINNLNSLQADRSYDCKDPKSVSMIEQFIGKAVTIGNVSASGLQCLGRGDDGVAFTGLVNGEEVVVKFLSSKQSKNYHLDFVEKMRALAANGAFPVIPLISEGFVKEAPTVYGEIWPRVAGKTFKQISESGGFQSSQDFMEFAKKCCEAILRLWGVGLQHGDLTSHNVMWDGEKRAVTLIDYEDMDEVGPDEKNIDVTFLFSEMLNRRVEIMGYGTDAVALMNDLNTHGDKYAGSLQDFKKFYESHFKHKHMGMGAGLMLSELEERAAHMCWTSRRPMQLISVLLMMFMSFSVYKLMSLQHFSKSSWLK